MTSTESKKPKNIQEPNFKGRYLYGIGKRKRAVAMARIYPSGKGFFVNDKPIEVFFGDKVLTEKALRPLTLVGLRGDLGISVKIHGGGKSGLADAISLAISRALVVRDEKLRIQLKPQGLLKRDSRKKERKKPGLHKARRGHQFSKR